MSVSSRKMTKQCICQICNCGRHHCPHKPRGTIPVGNQPCTISEYTNRYIQHPLERRENCKPPVEILKNAGPIDDKTTNRVDYIKHPMGDRYVHMPDQYIKPDGDMDMHTSYTKEYTKKPIDRTQPIRKDHSRKMSGKFEGLPTYRNDYRRWQLPDRKRYGGEAVYRPTSAPFEGKSTFTHDYIKYPINLRQSMKPEERALHSDDPFDDKTGYRVEYVKHPMPNRFVREKPTWNPNKQPLDGMSNYKKDYTEKTAPKQESCKPPAQAFESDAPFKGSTTHRSDFQKWAMERPYVHEPADYIKPDGIMDLNSTTHLHFPAHKVAARIAVRPPSRRKVTGDFDGTTNYREDFRKWNAGGRQKPMMKTDYVPPTAPFEGCSTFTAHYVQHKVDPAVACKPNNLVISSNTPFDDGTMYRMEYTKKKSAPCPAAILDTAVSNYVYKEQDEVGHKFYQPITESITTIPTQRICDNTGKIATLSLA